MVSLLSTEVSTWTAMFQITTNRFPYRRITAGLPPSKVKYAENKCIVCRGLTLYE